MDLNSAVNTLTRSNGWGWYLRGTEDVTAYSYIAYLYTPSQYPNRTLVLYVDSSGIVREMIYSDDID